MGGATILLLEQGGRGAKNVGSRFLKLSLCTVSLKVKSLFLAIGYKETVWPISTLN